MNEVERIDLVVNKLNKTISLNDVNISTHPEIKDTKFEMVLNNIDQDTLFQIRTSLESYDQIIEHPITDEPIHIRNQRHTKAFLERFKFKVDNRIIEDLTDDLILEVYSLNHQQLFRTVNFFSKSSYSLADLTFTPWEELFHRQEGIMGKLMKMVSTVIDNEINYMIPQDYSHIVTEISTQKKFKHQVLRMATLYSEIDNSLIGYVSLISIKERSQKITLLH